MEQGGAGFAKMLLRYAAPLSGLRRIPVLGGILSWTSRRLVPVNTLIWVQIQEGAAQGLWIRLNPRTGANVQQGIGEPVVQEAVQKYLRPGMTFYDLGANIGFFSLLAARMVGPSGHVVSFEPDPEIAARLRENLARNNFSHATVEQKVVWSGPATLSFARVDANASPDRGLGHVSADASKESQTISVEAVSLDQFVQSHPAPDFVKCDVEGAEVEVFAGGQQLLANRRPILIVEMHGAENHRTLTDKLTKLGYRCRDLDENHVLALPE